MIDEDALPFVLTDAERKSALWQKLNDELNKMLVIARGKNDGAIDWEKTLTLRGRIAALKMIIRLGDEPPQDGE